MSTAEKPAPKPAEKKKATPTTYTVLAMVDDDGWRDVGKFAAVGSNAAIKAYLEKHTTGTLTGIVAVPARSWQPVKPKTTTKVVTSLEPL